MNYFQLHFDTIWSTEGVQIGKDHINAHQQRAALGRV